MLYLPREEGQGLVEYGLVLILLAIVVVAIIGLLGGQISNLFSNVIGCFGPEGQRPASCS
jgi:pilus assembly protein Flp/PilA